MLYKNYLPEFKGIKMKKFTTLVLLASICSAPAFSVYAGVCHLKLTNNMTNPTTSNPQGPYVMKNIVVRDGSCDGGCPAQVNENETVSFSSNGTNWSTVLTTSIYSKASPNTNIGSFRIEIQNADSTCTPVNIYSDYCSTDPSKGKADCHFVLKGSEIKVEAGT